MKTSILIATYGDEAWRDLAWSRAYPSTDGQGAHEVLVHHEPDASIAQVRNQLGEDASGDWLCFLDADDELGAGYLRAIASAHERATRYRSLGKWDLYAPAVSYVHVTGKRRPPAPLRHRGTLQDDNYIVVGTVVPRELFLQVGGFGDYPHGYEDWSLWAKCWKAGAKINHVRNAIYYAWLMPNSKHREAWKDRKWQVEMHHKVRKDIFPELYAK